MGIVSSAVAGLSWLGGLSDPLAWLVVAAFVAGAVVERYDSTAARYVMVGTWVLFAVFWLSVVHHFAFVQKSIIEGLGTALAVPACLSVATLLARGRDSLLVLSRSVAIMGVVFLPFEAVPLLRRTLIETVTAQTSFLISLLDVEHTVVSGLTLDGYRIAEKTYPYDSTLAFYQSGAPITLTIKMACTGIGSMAVFAGLIAAVDAPVDRKLRAVGASIPVIYALNLVRNVFIGVGFGTQRFHVFPDVISAMFAVENSIMVSYYVVDRLISQSLSVVVLVGITWIVVHQVPELLGIIEDAIYAVTRQDLDLRTALGVREVRADGEG
jgi:archaeosortase A (PGF-CTERM-specific)